MRRRVGALRMMGPLVLAGIVGMAGAAAALEAAAEAPVSTCNPPPDEPDLLVPSPGPREAQCGDYAPWRTAFFGDLHVHTSWSFDAYLFGNQENGPAEAVAYAKGGTLELVGGRTSRLSRPLDFVAVTDHGEYLGENEICTTPDEAPMAYDSLHCRHYRGEQGIPGVNPFTAWGLRFGVPYTPRHDFCAYADCTGVAASRWEELARINDAANEACAFTTLNAYEYSSSELGSRMHRNVIFANDHLIERPVTYFEEPTPEGLNRALNDQCRAEDGCQLVAIPHNSNQSHGRLLFVDPLRLEDPTYRQSQAEIAWINRLVEITQVKGTSECRLGLGGTTDEECAFQQLQFRRPLCCNPTAGVTENCVDPATNRGCQRVCMLDRPEPGLWVNNDDGCTASHDYVRNALKDGLVAHGRLGFNPMKLGFVGATDTHNSVAGMTEEDGGPLGDVWPGAHGRSESSASKLAGRGKMGNSAGGLTGVWAEENTREAIFAALWRRETFATSGTRMKVRLFAGDYAEGMCDLPPNELLETAYEKGVPMGQDLPARSWSAGESPRFVLLAEMDENPLQRAEIVKVWTGADGEPGEKVVALTPDPLPLATVHPDCSVTPASEDSVASLCHEWVDPDFDPAEPATYYGRVFEDLSCRWPGHACRVLFEDGLDCADSPTHVCCPGHANSAEMHGQERAWTSPIWIDPTCGDAAGAG